jgi:predicted DNA-binding transcriptional regulator AlpA
MGERFLTYNDLRPKKGINFCRQHLGRLEEAGQFPQRRQLSAGRIGWLESEIDQYLHDLPRGPLPEVGDKPKQTTAERGQLIADKPKPSADTPSPQTGRLVG